jgi:hypothetical protein
MAFALRRKVLGSFLFAGTLATTMAGCALTVERSAPIPEGASIVVVTPARPHNMIFANYGDAKSFIPFYGFFKQTQAMATQPLIDDEIRASGFRVEEELQNALVRDLLEKSVDVQGMKIARPAEVLPSALKTSELRVPERHWAVIDARVTAFGILAELSGEFRPMVCVIVRMLDARTKLVLYEKRFAYNYARLDFVRIPFEPSDSWPNIGAVKNDIPGVESAIRRGISKITELIAADIAAT